MPYTEGFKARMIERMAGPEGISATALSEEVGVPQPTLSRWLRMRPTRRVGAMKDENQGPKGKKRTAEQKLRLVLEASELSNEELGAFLRREGVHEAELKEWTAAAMEAMSPKPKRKAKASREVKRIRELEKDLRRKEKALAEVTALLALKKKLEAIWGDGDDDTRTRNET
jgi:predicted RNase H-like nuclease (RuvC/YqgF family)